MSCLKAVSVVKLPFRTPRAPVEHFCPPDLVPRDITACPVYHDALSNITPVTLKLTNHFAPGQTYLYSSWLCHVRCWISIWCGSTMATAINSAVLYQYVGARVQSHAWAQGQQILHTFLGHAPNSAMSATSLDIFNHSVFHCVWALLVSSVVCTFCEYHRYWYWKNVVPSSTCAL